MSAAKFHMLSSDMVIWHCPGCQCSHVVPVNGSKGENGAAWQWNGSLENPTLSPSILCNSHDAASRCHCFVKEGSIQFLDDCFHALAGKTIPVPDWDELVIPEGDDK